MNRTNLFGILLEFDPGRTSAILKANPMRDWCQCDSCMNGRIASQRFAPAGVAERLSELGIDAARAFHREPRTDATARGDWYWSVAYWPIVGKVDSPGRAKISRDAFIELGPEFSTSVSAWRVLEEENLAGMQDLLFLKVFTRIPWIPGEVGELRYVNKCMPCPKCGHDWRWTAYVKGKSRIPVWYESPDLKAALRLSKTRVFASFCLECGDLDYKIVSDRPPFRKKTLEERLEQKRLNRLWRSMV